MQIPVTRTTCRSHLPEYLQEVCSILARGVVRLHGRSAEEYAGSGNDCPDSGDNSLHYPPDQSGHANPTKRRRA